MTVYAHCPVHSRELAYGVGLVCALLALAGAWHSWRVRRALPAVEGGEISMWTDRFIATLSIFLACISVLAIIFGTTAGLFLRCER